MISTTSLQAFSAATTTGPINRANQAAPVRLVRGAADQAAQGGGSASGAATPAPRPGLVPPRGSLLNLSA